MGWGEVSLFGPGTCRSVGYVLRVCYLQQGILELVQIFILTGVCYIGVLFHSTFCYNWAEEYGLLYRGLCYLGVCYFGVPLHSI